MKSKKAQTASKSVKPIPSDVKQKEPGCYVVVDGYDKEFVEQAACRFLAAGWKLVGGISIAYDQEASCLVFAQALSR